METLFVIGVALVIATALCAIVEQLAADRGRNTWAWTIASFIGLWFAFIGWLVVVAALVVIGPAHGADGRGRAGMLSATRAGHP